RGVGAGLLHGVAHGVEDRPALVGGAALARRHAADDGGEVGLRLLRVKSSFASGESLDDQPRRFIDQNSHSSMGRNHEDVIFVSLRDLRGSGFQPASSTTFFAASSIASAVVKFMPLSRNRRLPSSTLVPSMRMTIGTGTPSSFTAPITPCASTSQRRMPPKILINTAFTVLS